MITFPERVKRILVNQKEVEIEGEVVANEQPESGDWQILYLQNRKAGSGGAMARPLPYRVQKGEAMPPIGTEIAGFVAWAEGHYVLEEVRPISSAPTNVLPFPGESSPQQDMPGVLLSVAEGAA